MTDSPQPNARGSVRGNALVIEILVEQIRDDVTAYALRDEMISLFDSAGTNHIVLDFQHVNFVGSIGFLAFLAIRRRVDDGQIVICNFTDSIRTLFELCRLVSKDPSEPAAFQEAKSVDEALKRLAE
jgi:anti-anti-sigma factor